MPPIVAFTGQDMRLFRTDGTPGGTRIRARRPGGEHRGNTSATERHPDVHGDPTRQLTTLWRTDGTAGGTVKLGDSDRRSIRQFVGDRASTFEHHFRRQLQWKSVGHRRDGRADVRGGRHPVRTTVSRPPPARCTSSPTPRPRVYEPWVSDGTQQAGSPLLKDINPGSCRIAQHRPGDGRLNGQFYFTAQSPDTGDELWTTDGTPAGTVIVKDAAPGPLAPPGRTSDTASGCPLTFNRKIYFEKIWTGSGRQVFESDGTADWYRAGALRRRNTLTSSFRGPPLVHDGYLYFRRLTGAGEMQTSTRTRRRAAESFVARRRRSSSAIEVVGGKIYMSAGRARSNGAGLPNSQLGLWSTDERCRHTSGVSNLKLDIAIVASNRQMWPGQRRLVFPGTHSRYGVEPWVFDPRRHCPGRAHCDRRRPARVLQQQLRDSCRPGATPTTTPRSPPTSRRCSPGRPPRSPTSPATAAASTA